MVKKIVSIGLIFILAVVIVSSSYCAAGGDNGPMKKLGRGAANVLTFPFEIPYRIGQANKSDGPYAAFTYGVIKGVVMSGFRALVGTYEILSFAFPLPEGYAPIITDPEFFFEGETY